MQITRNSCTYPNIMKILNCPWDWGQIGMKLGTKHVIYQKLVKCMQKMDIYVNRLESVTLACKNVFYRPEQNTKEGPYEIEF